MVGGAALIYASTLSPSSVKENAWQDCSIFVAPSKLPHGGWGIFAAR
jgi:hypothetical protein